MAQMSPASRGRRGISGEVRSIGPSTWASVKLSVLESCSVDDREGDRSILHFLVRL